MAREVATAYTGANVSLTIGSTLLTNAFGISYEVTQNKRPIYGYNSMHYNAVARGQVLVLGQLYINFQHPSYLSKVLNQYYLEYARNRDRFDSTIRTKDVDVLSVGRSIESTISSYNSNADLSSDLLNAIYNDPALRANAGAMFTNNRTRSEVKSGHGLATITSKINDQQTPSGLTLNEVGRQTSSAIYARPDQFSGLGSLGGTQLDIIITYGDPNGMTNEFGVTSFMGSSSIVLRDVHFLGEAQQIMADDQPIMETYKFMARKKEVLIGTNVKTPVNVNEGEAVKAAKAAEEAAKMAIADFTKNFKAKPTVPTAPVPAPVAAVEPEKPTIAPIPEQFGIEMTQDEINALNITPAPVNSVYPVANPFQGLEGETIYQNSVGVINPNMFIDPTPRSRVPAVPGSPFSEIDNGPAGTGTAPNPPPTEGTPANPAASATEEEDGFSGFGRTAEQRRAAAEAAASPTPAPTDAVPLTPEQQEERALEGLGRTAEQRRADAAAAAAAAPTPAPTNAAAPEEEVMGDRQRAKEAEALARGAAAAAAAAPTTPPTNAAAPDPANPFQPVPEEAPQVVPNTNPASNATPTPAPAETTNTNPSSPFSELLGETSQPAQSSPASPTAPSPTPPASTPAVDSSPFSEVPSTTANAPSAAPATPPVESVNTNSSSPFTELPVVPGNTTTPIPVPVPTAGPTPSSPVSSPAAPTATAGPFSEVNSASPSEEEAPSATVQGNVNSNSVTTPAVPANTTTPVITSPTPNTVNNNPSSPFEEVPITTNNAPASAPRPAPTTTTNSTPPSANNPPSPSTGSPFSPVTTSTSAPSQPPVEAVQPEPLSRLEQFLADQAARSSQNTNTNTTSNPIPATPPRIEPAAPATPPAPSPTQPAPVSASPFEDLSTAAPTPPPTNSNGQPAPATGGILPNTGTSNAPPATPQPAPPAPTEPSSPPTPTVDKPVNPFEEL